ncbi:MAG: flagellar filament capping protein FliD [Candidatus Aureabacteria bacterium]|nr:flagellar filament capping protein FliD [Candidatus Auribacterota bacterium]
MALTTTSFFEIEETVNQLMALERRPLDTIIQRRDDMEASKIVYDLLNSKLKTLQATLDTLCEQASFETKKTVISDDSVVTATSSVGASEIMYDIEVTSLAEAARIESSGVLSLVAGTETKITGLDIKAGGGPDDADINAAINSGLGLAVNEINAGEFVINDVTIEVYDSDTIATILSRITSSSAGVDAYIIDDIVYLEQKTVGSTNDIELGSDTANFFTAMRIGAGDRGGKADGVDEDVYRTIDDVAGLAGISTGYFTINNVTFYVDTSSDSLSDVINRVNSSAANASMFYDETLDKVVVTSDIEGDHLYFKNDNAAFLDTLKILDVDDDGDDVGDQDATVGESRYEGTAAVVIVNGSTLNPTSNEFTIMGTTFNLITGGGATATVDVDNNDDYMKNQLTNFVDQYNSTLDFIREKKKNELSHDISLIYLENSLITKMQSSISNIGNFKNLSRVGIKFGSGANSGKLTFDTNSLDEALLTDRGSVMKLFAYDDDSDGLYDDGGFANTTYDFLYNYTRAGLGIIYKKKSTIDTRISQMDISIRRKEERMSRRRIQLTVQFEQVNRALQMMEIRIQKMNGIFSNNLALISGQYLL